MNSFIFLAYVYEKCRSDKQGNMKKIASKEVRLLRANKEVYNFGQGVKQTLNIVLKDLSFLSVVYTLKVYGWKIND